MLSFSARVNATGFVMFGNVLPAIRNAHKPADFSSTGTDDCTQARCPSLGARASEALVFTRPRSVVSSGIDEMWRNDRMNSVV